MFVSMSDRVQSKPLCRGIMLFFWIIASLLTCSDGFENFGLPKGWNPNSTSLSASGNSRLVGGTLTTVEKYPFTVSLQHEWDEYEHDYIHFCTGSIISETWVLTSVPCALLCEQEVCFVRVGSSIFHEGGQLFGIESVTMHPLFHEMNNDFNAALLKLNDTMKYGPGVQPIPLPDPNAMASEDGQITVIAWGIESLIGSFIEQLSESSLSVTTNEICEDFYGADLINSRMFCTQDNEKGLCVGNVGAPAMANGVMIGLVSWFYGCAPSQFPSVFMRITPVMEWITEIAAPSSGTTLTPFFFPLFIILQILLNISHY